MSQASAVFGQDRAAFGFFRLSTIRVRLTVAFLLLAFMLALLGGVGAWRLSQLGQATAEKLRVQQLLGEWLAAAESNTVRAEALARSDDAGLHQALAPQLEAANARMAQMQQLLQAAAGGVGSEALSAAAAGRAKDYALAQQAVLGQRAAGQSAQAAALLEKDLLPASVAYLASLRALQDFHGGGSRSEAGVGASMMESGLALWLLMSAVVVIVAFVFCYPLTVNIVKPIRVAARIAQKVAAGDLTVQVRTGGGDEAAQLMRSLAEMTVNLRRLLGEVAGGAHAVADSSRQIVQGNAELSQRTEEQASTLEQTASSLEELTSTVAQNAEHARQASQLAEGAAQVARQGGEAVGRVVATMTDIAAASRRIGDIIGVIDGIAFQTNILALNAAVEAARAGEQGRGFAVVAAEVRSLAQRSATAAREIKALVGDSVDKVDTGTRQVDAAGKTMDEIVGSVGKVSERIAEIAAASREQSTGIEQVNTAVTHMDQVVQQNAALVEQASVATEAMKAQAAALLQMVARFQVTGGEAPGRPDAAAPAPAPVAVAAAAAAAVATAPAPIRFKPAAARPVASAAGQAPPAPRLARNGDWTEF